MKFSYSGAGSARGLYQCLWYSTEGGQAKGLHDYVTANGKDKEKIELTCGGHTTLVGDYGLQIAFNITQIKGASGYDTFKKSTDALTAAKWFSDNYEKGGWDEKRGSSAEAVYKVLSSVGTSSSSNSNKASKDSDSSDTEHEQEQAEVIATAMAANGFWSEEQLGSYCSLYEINVAKVLEDAKRESLGQNDLTTLHEWELNVDDITESHDLIYWLRVLTMFLGIILTVWTLLIYIAFWFDRLNNFVELDILGLLTIGRLHVSPDDNEANYSLTKKENNVRVSHKDILKICIISL